MSSKRWVLVRWSGLATPNCAPCFSWCPISFRIIFGAFQPYNLPVFETMCLSRSHGVAGGKNRPEEEIPCALLPVCLCSSNKLPVCSFFFASTQTILPVGHSFITIPCENQTGLSPKKKHAGGSFFKVCICPLYSFCPQNNPIPRLIVMAGKQARWTMSSESRGQSALGQIKILLICSQFPTLKCSFVTK